MATTEVVCNFPMTYAGIKRYKGEIFNLIGAVNDEKLMRVGHVRLLGDYDRDLISRDDATGREFTDEQSRIAYRRDSPSDAQILRRGPGRPRKPKLANQAVVIDG